MSETTRTTDGRTSERVGLRFLGAAGTVTGSRFLLEYDERRVLVDCGLFQGDRRWRRRNWDELPVDPGTVDAVVLTHAHLDHSGALPLLARGGFSGPVICTPATAQLAAIVLRDAAHLQEEEAAYANEAGFSKHVPALPLFDSADAEKAIRLLRPVDHEIRAELPGDASVVLRRAGHILGSAFAELRLGDTRVTFSGDMGRSGHPLLRPPERPGGCNVMVVESTYGDRLHEVGGDRQLADVIRRTAHRGGVCLLPAFAVDRTPVLLLVLAALKRSGEIPDLPVFVDSPMALEALRVYRDAVAAGDPQVRAEIVAGHRLAEPPGLHLMPTRADSERLNRPDRPCIVISASGMATGGRVLHHLKHQLPEPRNSVILTGFQVPGTRGRQLADGARQVKIHGRYVQVAAEVVNVRGYSAHADSDELMAWLGSGPAPDMTYVVHGEPDASTALAQRLRDELFRPAVAPRYLEKVRIT